jgi:hypothetical protein
LNSFLFTCKLLGLAGETEYPLSFVDETLPDGLVRLSFVVITTISILSFRLVVPLAVETAGGDVGFVSS